MSQVKALLGFLRQKISGTPYRHELFRVGMTVSVEPTVFLLGEGALRVTAPASMDLGVVAVGDVVDGAIHTTRLYLPEAGSFLHLMIEGERVLECRFFSPLDSVEPADPDEWGFWLAPEDGMIGYPSFQIKDGTLYQRHWAAGGAQVEPRHLSESVQAVDGVTTRTHQTMLYARATGLADPAPLAEYLLVTATEQGGAAWVDLSVGIDIPPASLGLI